MLILPDMPPAVAKRLYCCIFWLGIWLPDQFAFHFAEAR